MKKLPLLITGIFLLLLSVSPVKVLAAGWGDGGNFLYSPNNVFLHGWSFGAIGNVNSKLGILSTEGNAWITLYQSNYGTRYAFHNAADGSKLELATYDGTNGQTHWGVLSIIRNGDVVMGTNYDGVNLKVNGYITTRGLTVTNNGWADFVFEDGYKLPALSEVENFIEQNGHLPGIESAKEIEENGLSLGEMQGKQMQKIEELTLYAIEQEKKIEGLERAIEELKELILAK